MKVFFSDYAFVVHHGATVTNSHVSHTAIYTRLHLFSATPTLHQQLAAKGQTDKEMQPLTLTTLMGHIDN